MKKTTSRRSFVRHAGIGMLGAAAAEGLLHAGLAGAADAKTPDAKRVWKSVSDRKIRVGIAGYGFCQFGAAWGFQDHPNVTVAAVSDLIPERCAGLAKACRCGKTYPSLETMLEDDTLEAIFVATDAPSHARHCIQVLKRGKHVATAVPAVWGEAMEEADALFEAVRSSGRKYMMLETSAFYDECHAMRQVYRAGGFGKLVYSEGEYYHNGCALLPSFRDWRIGMPPQWYPTHSTAFYVCVAGGSFTEVSCMGIPSVRQELQPANNRYKNPFGTEIALFRTSDAGMSRMAVSWDTPGHEPLTGRVRGQRGSMTGMSYEGDEKKLPDLQKPPLPPSVAAGHHGGSSGHLMNEFVTAILEDRTPMIDIAMALNLTVCGIVAHRSALKGGELMKIPQYKWPKT